MGSNTVKTRIQLKNDTEAHWDLAQHFIPLQGEVIIYSADDAHPFSRLKVGDGSTYVRDLPFLDAGSVSGKNIYADTTSNWNSKTNYIPKLGDIIIYIDRIMADKMLPGIKIGDGQAYCIDLPFLSEELSSSLNAHISDTNVHVTSQEKNFWSNKINCEETVIEENLILTRN